MARSTRGTHWPRETKGREDPDVARKDARAERRCADAAAPAGVEWRYRKVPREEIRAGRPQITVRAAERARHRRRAVRVRAAVAPVRSRWATPDRRGVYFPVVRERRPRAAANRVLKGHGWRQDRREETA